MFGNDGKIRQTVREPDISRHERKMYVSALLPKSLWSTPALKATINVTEDNHEPKFTIDLQAAADAMRQSLGVDIDMRIVPPESDAEEFTHDDEVSDRLREERSLTG